MSRNSGIPPQYYGHRTSGGSDINIASLVPRVMDQVEFHIPPAPSKARCRKNMVVRSFVFFQIMRHADRSVAHAAGLCLGA